MSDFGTFHATTEPWISRAARSKYGDPTRDAAVFERYSPLVHAAHVRAPLTLVHGANDTNVPPSESEQMASAVTAAGGARVVIVEGEGHDFVRPEGRRLVAQEARDAVLDALAARDTRLDDAACGDVSVTGR